MRGKSLLSVKWSCIEGSIHLGRRN